MLWLRIYFGHMPQDPVFASEKYYDCFITREVTLNKMAKNSHGLIVKPYSNITNT